MAKAKKTRKTRKKKPKGPEKVPLYLKINKDVSIRLKIAKAITGKQLNTLVEEAIIKVYGTSLKGEQ